MNEDIGRYVATLESLITRSGLRKFDLEQRLGWSRGALTKVLKGRQKLTVGDVLSLLRVLDIEPLSFYTLVHGEAGRGDEAPNEAAFRRLGPGVRPLVLSLFLSDADLDRKITEAVDRALSRREGEP